MDYVFSEIVGQIIDWQSGDTLYFDNLQTPPTSLRPDASYAAPTTLTIFGGPENGDSVTLNNVTLGGLAGDLGFASGGKLLLGNNLDNLKKGTTAADMLVGFGGDDTLMGGRGRDLFLMSPGTAGDTGTDVISGGGGMDLIAFGDYWSEGVTVDLRFDTFSGGSISGVERISGTGYSDVLVGDSRANELDGRSGDDWLNGGFGLDTLSGGDGIDRFVFNQTVGGNNFDLIRGFETNQDLILLDDAKFAGLGAAGTAISPKKFSTGADATANNAQNLLIYDSTNGKLYFDADATGIMSPVLIARLGSNPQDLDVGDFSLI